MKNTKLQELFPRMKISNLFFFALTAIVLCSVSAKAQDTLYMKSGIKIASQIKEVTPELVRYKKSDNPEGPLFIINASDINLIKYRNGTIDTIKAPPVTAPTVTKPVISTPVAAKMAVDPHPAITPAGMNYRYGNRRISKREMYEVLQSVHDPEIDLHVKKTKTAKGIEYIGFVAIPALVFGVLYTGVTHISRGSGDLSSSYTPGVVSLGLAAATFGTSITFKIIGKNHKESALRLYNQKY